MQRGRFLILLGILIAVAALGLVLIMRPKPKPPSPTATVEGEEGAEAPPVLPSMTKVVVAANNIPRGTRILTGTNYVVVTDWPQDWVAESAFTRLDEVIGKIARVDIPRGSPIVRDMLTETPGDLGAVGSDLALQVPPGKVVFALPADLLSSVAWSLQPGDHVDVLISFLFVNLDEEFQSALPNLAAPYISGKETIPSGSIFGRFEQDAFGQPLIVSPREDQRPSLVSQITVQDAIVLAVGDQQPGLEEVPAPPAQPPQEGEPTPMPTTATTRFLGPREPVLLIVDPQDALTLKWAVEAGASIDLVMRSYADAGRLVTTESVTLQYMMERFNIALPPKLPVGIQPPVQGLERTFVPESNIPTMGEEAPPQ
ncbi:MAG: Flp pilus assembly protein CpaB [Chloroflexi bacterium]|nr:MAG: Flp pilus assembly protein CpaB [Chloroflexota bacterium]